MDWATYMADPSAFRIGYAARETFKLTLERSMAALEAGVHQYFAPLLRQAEAWRAWPDFRHSCAYVDIETDGGRSGQSVTTIGLWDGKSFQCFVKGDNLANFVDAISHYSMIVTFFGTGFDVPMIQKAFRGIDLDQIHLDLCPTLRQLGYKGGLKKIEKEFGITRCEEAEGLSGLDAIRLWRAYQRGDEKSLQTLIAYNREDVVNLETLAEAAYTKLRKLHMDNLQMQLVDSSTQLR